MTNVRHEQMPGADERVTSAAEFAATKAHLTVVLAAAEDYFDVLAVDSRWAPVYGGRARASCYP
jgi:hypothetical protein